MYVYYRENIFKQYQEICKLKGTTLVDHAVKMQYPEYKYNQKVLWKREDYETRAFLGLDLSLIGRVSEVSTSELSN